MNPNSDLVNITCPDCGNVEVLPDIFSQGNPISAICPKCDDRIFFSSGGELSGKGYLTRFEPDNMKQGIPTASVEFTMTPLTHVDKKEKIEL